MRYLSVLVFALFLLLNTQSVSAYQELIVDRLDGRNVNVVRVVLDGQHYVVSSLAFTGGDTLENLTQKIPGAQASINGVFFCPKEYSYCNGETTTISERAFLGNPDLYSRYRPDTGIRGMFGFTRDGEPLLAQNNFGYIEGLAENLNSDRMDDFFFGLGNWPVILMDGKDVVYGSEAHLDNKLKSRRTQAFICHTKYSNEVFLGTVEATTIYEMPKFLTRNFACHNAINLDAGASLAMTYGDSVLRRAPRRNIMDAFVVVSREGYETLTDYSPPAKTPYTNPKEYILTQEDRNMISTINQQLDKLVARRLDPKNREILKKTIISMLYKGFESDKVQQEPRRKKMVQELILSRTIVDKL